MKIVRLKTAVVEGNFDWTFVRIETGQGLRGLGECFFAPGDLIEGVPKPIIQNGFIEIPEKRGLGVTLNEEVARRYARKGEPFFE